ncbi:enkurin [Cochliomyia hominivorax]
MSLVYITYHDENIFDVDKEKDYFTTREKLNYTSKFRNMVKEEKQARHIVELPDRKKLLTSAIKNNHQTMGYAQTPKDLPCNFLKKNNGIKWQRLNEHKCPPKKEIPPVPKFLANKHGEKPIDKEIHAHRANFIAVNIDLIKNLKCKRPPPRYVDTPKGDRHNLLNTGLVPQYICSKKFAKVPNYLNGRKLFLNKLNAQCVNARLEAENACVRPVERFPGVKKLTLNERQEILEGLKTNFTELFKNYQRLSLHTDTIAKKLHKSKLENDLRQLEQDIYLMEHNPDIYVSEY